MAKLGNLFFTRTLNQFLECDDTGSRKALDLIQKIRESAGQNVEKLMTTVTRVDDPHREILKDICREKVAGFTEDFFLDTLSHEQTIFRVAASDILSHNSTLDSSKLLARLHEPNARKGDIMGVLKAQKHSLKPEAVINHALKLNSDFSVELLKLLDETSPRVNLSMVHIPLDKIKNDSIKVHLLTYLGKVDDPKVPSMVARFLADPNKVVVSETLKTLDRITIPYDVSFMLSSLDNMSGINLELALKIVAERADANLVPHLSSQLNSRSSERNDFFAGLVAKHADAAGFEKFLQRLKLEDDWDRQQSIACVQKLAGENLSEAARQLASHEDEYIRNTAQQLVINLIGDEDLERIEEFALGDNWQVRERAIQSLAKSSNRHAIAILKKLVAHYPEDFVLALRAVRKLGFGEGLEIAFDALNSAQANVQRTGLETVAAIVSEKHAQTARDNLLRHLPSINEELQDYTRQLIAQITRDYGLEEVQLDGESNTAQTADISIDITLDSTSDAESDQNCEPSSPLDELLPGSVWMGRYKITKEIGRGAMGRVMLVEDDMVDESLILKFMLPRTTTQKNSTERFKREVKYARRVSHRNVIRVHDLLFQDDICAISMEYFKSRGLEEILNRRQCFETRDGLKILYQVSNGMAAAHAEGVIHRDLKPSNILINHEGHVKVVDFGIASAGSGAKTTLTGTGAIIGSPAYLAPERATGDESDVRSDIYSLGVIAYYMFAGQLPYTGRPMEVLAQHRGGNALPITKINEAASPRVSKLILRMMAVDPAVRPQTMLEVRDAVKALLDAS